MMNKTTTKTGKTKKVEKKKPLSLKEWFASLTWAKPKQWIIALIPAAIIIAADQISKAIVVSSIKIPGKAIWLIEPLLKLTYAQNPLGIFSLSFGPRFLYFVLPSLAVILVIVFLLRPQRSFVAILLGVIMGGGIGNLIDRIRVGYVIDWISMGFKNWRWATYNIADGSVVVAVIILLIVEFFFSKPKKEGVEKEE